MSRRRQSLAASAFALAACVVALSLVAPSGGSASGSASVSKGGFSPALIKGKWIGKWTNTTFDTTGTIRANVKELGGEKLSLLADFGGPVFGCNNPAPASATLPKNGSPNGWTSKGFQLSQATQAFGNLKVTYVFASGSFKGSGSAPPCNPSITYTIKGKLTPTKFNATVSIDLGTQTATSVLTAKKH